MIRKLFGSGIFQAGQILFNLLFNLTLAYHFGASREMDCYVVTANFIMAFSGLFGMAQSSAFIPFISNFSDIKLRQKAIHAVILMNAMAFTLLGLLLMLFSNSIAFFLAPGFGVAEIETSGRLLKIMGGMVLLINVAGIGSGILDFEQKFERRYFISFFQSVLSLFVLLPLTKGWGIYGASLASLVGLALIFPFFLRMFYSRKYIGGGLGPFDSTAATQYLKLLAPVFYSGLFVWAVRYADIFAASFLKSGNLALLNYCQRVENYCSVIVAVVCSMYYPALSRHAGLNERTSEFVSHYREGLQAVFLSASLIAGFVFLFAKPLIFLLLTRGAFTEVNARELADLLRLYSPALVFAPMGIFLANGFFSCRKTKLATVISIISASLNVVGSLTMGYFWGLKGILISGCFAFGFGNVLQGYYTQQLHPALTLRTLCGLVARPGLAIGFAGLAMASLSRWIDLDRFREPISLGFCLLFLGLLYGIIAFIACHFCRVSIVERLSRRIKEKLLN